MDTTRANSVREEMMPGNRMLSIFVFFLATVDSLAAVDRLTTMIFDSS
jgi:hypothetical protein